MKRVDLFSKRRLGVVCPSEATAKASNSQSFAAVEEAGFGYALRDKDQPAWPSAGAGHEIPPRHVSSQRVQALLGPQY